MKGGLGVIVFLLILILVGILIFLYFYSLPKNQNQNQQSPFKNEVITIENVQVSNTKPYVNSLFTYSFLIANNGEYPTDVEIDFFDVSSFRLTSFHCEDGKVVGNKCLVSLDSLDKKEILITLKAPDESIVSISTPFSISYSIAYNYSGLRAMFIPVIDGITKKTPSGSFRQTDPTYGPIVVEFEPPVGAEKKEDSKIIKEYWARSNIPFLVKIKVRDVVYNSLGKVQPTRIRKEDFNVEIKGIKIAEEFKTTCDFEEYTFLNPKSDFEVPKDFLCYFKSETSEPEITAQIFVNFSYTYKYIKSETFIVQPLPKV